MEEQLISFETSKLAKTKGFNYECLFIYYSDYRVEAGKLSQQSFKNDWNNAGDMYNSAPTQSLLQKWLREKYNIMVDVVATYHEKDLPLLPNVFPKPDYYIAWDYYDGDFCDEDTPHFKKYEDALEFGLQRSLNYLTNESQI